jgi:16S rRNA (cytidine1402-2'-O)-methyltransferase
VVAAAAREGLAVTVVPGPSAVLAALAVSGLPTDRFCFEGFLSRRAGERAAALADLAAEPRTMVFFEAPHRLAATLGAMAGAFGADREAAVCRELTKTYEEVRRGGLGELAAWAGDSTVLGEVTVVVRGVHRGPVAASAALVHEVEGLVATGTRLKEAVGDVAGRTGARRNELYDAVLAARAADRERPVVDRTSAAGVDSRTAVTGGMPQGAEEIRWPGRRSDLAGSRHEEDV